LNQNITPVRNLYCLIKVLLCHKHG
jgi:hypothetical protein